MLRVALLGFGLSHLVGFATMALLLRPGVDALEFSWAERASYIATHAGAWWLGWLPWRLAALTNLWVGVELRRWAKLTESAPAQRSASTALVLVIVAAIPEQWAEWRLVTTFIGAARGDLLVWSRSWSLYAGITGVWAALGYTIATRYWMKTVATLQGRSVLPPHFERALIGALLLSAVLTLGMVSSKEAEAGVWFAASSVVSCVAFPTLLVWSLALWRQLAPRTDWPRRQSVTVDEVA